MSESIVIAPGEEKPPAPPKKYARRPDGTVVEFSPGMVLKEGWVELDADAPFKAPQQPEAAPEPPAIEPPPAAPEAPPKKTAKG